MDMIDRDKLITESAKRLNADMARINTGLLILHLREQAKHYKDEIVPLHPDKPHGDADFENFDAAKNIFLENLWNVIYQHFTDNGDV